MRAVSNGLAAISALAAAPFAAGALLLHPEWRTGLRERLGAQPQRFDEPIWVHAASVGEILSAIPLISALRCNGCSIHTSTITMRGREVMRRRLPDLACYLAPIDHLWCVEAALARVRPSALALVETELWPTWIAAVARRSVPVVLVSARISDRSYPRYRRLQPWIGRALRRVAAIGARTEIDAERFVALGASPRCVRVTGDLKADPANPPALASDLAAVARGAPLFVAGSTHPGEEEALLDTLALVESAGLDCALAIAPRHIERVTDVVAVVRSRGREPRLRSALGGASLSRGDVLVIDTVGELGALYSRARVAFVGGTLAPAGGHNVLEPAFAGTPVLYGPGCENIPHAVAMVESCDAGRCVRDGADLAREVVAALRDPEGSSERGERGRKMLERHRGSTGRSVDLIRQAVAVAEARPGAPGSADRN